MKKEQSTEKISAKSPNRVPWWVSVLMAIGSYCLLKFVIPNLHPTNAAFQKLSQIAPTFAPITAILFLLLAAKQLYDIDADTSNRENGNPDSSQEEKPEE